MSPWSRAQEAENVKFFLWLCLVKLKLEDKEAANVDVGDDKVKFDVASLKVFFSIYSMVCVQTFCDTRKSNNFDKFSSERFNICLWKQKTISKM